ncbi:oligopeptide/dipeptide ABC transporter, ATP-binding protein [Sphaerochaeta pleomorpha str. Grapes]|uniref:Oligopeptide/dipeptide ABC transporter, ATP-binding protein n=1 Tax=Sphaerochaeta pleomorpha (strain ATCC BAA-1885 / DSM 22778 / Grapes) TaxID=158190 RepID=G8QZ03_SPHPG|nr:ABC transporter ATP-binding protein [Sphaerochaeta pleomorpha]AEV30862.1 oligopeptide/dipeptide ABC transporter, ATP-binding protein [Sphaerochaeta pleomorpha str. Grapes]
MSNQKELIKIEDLTIHYETDDGIVKALNGVSLSMKEGETLGLVGETGAGKTTLARGILALVPSPPGVIKGGKITFQGNDLLKFTENQMRNVRGNAISMIFQDPMTSLNPVMSVGDQIMEVVEAHNKEMDKSEICKQANRMLEMVGISADRAHEYPHQFSGGMKQRVIIAIALACNPVLLIADEPTTALDVTIQAQVLDMIRALKARLNTAMLLITHDLGVVAQNCDRVAIIYAGEIVEIGSLHHIFKEGKHPYTLGLLGSIPSLTKNVKRLSPIKGLMPDPTDLPPGCKFSPRCKFSCAECNENVPNLYEVSEGHWVRCILCKDEVQHG